MVVVMMTMGLAIAVSTNGSGVGALSVWRSYRAITVPANDPAVSDLLISVVIGALVEIILGHIIKR